MISAAQKRERHAVVPGQHAVDDRLDEIGDARGRAGVDEHGAAAPTMNRPRYGRE